MAKKSGNIDSFILDFLLTHQNSSSSEILTGLGEGASLATVKRSLQRLAGEQLIASVGQGRATQYNILKAYSLLLSKMRMLKVPGLVKFFFSAMVKTG